MTSIKADLLALLVGVCISAEPGPAPSGLQCVFMEFANVTCQWESGEDTYPDTLYILQVNQTKGTNDSVYKQHQCQTVSETQCSVPINNSLNKHYCIRVTAKSSHTNASSPTLCTDAIDAAKLYAPIFSGLSAILGKPRCLSSSGLILKSSPSPRNAWKQGPWITSWSTARGNSPNPISWSALSHWSHWSGLLQAHTEEAAPSIPPQLWRLIERERVTRLETSHFALEAVTKARGKRQNFRIPLSNSAGHSPPAVIIIPSALHKESRDPVAFSVAALDNVTLEVRWDVHAVLLASGFLVEWCVAAESSPCRPHWQKLGPNCAGVNITDAGETHCQDPAHSNEGVCPKVCYNVSVRAEFGAEAGPEQSVLAYTRQGVPSAGPRLHVTELGSRSLSLQWDPIPLERRHGFVHNYTLYYKSINHNTTWLVVSGNLRQYRLSGLSGQYRIYMTASTEAGQGAAGPTLTVVVEGYTPSVLTVLRCGVPPLLALLILFSCLRWRQRIKHAFWPWVPDPSQSSLSLWMTGKVPVHKAEMKDSKDTNDQRSTNKDLLSFIPDVNLSALDSALGFPIILCNSCDPPWTKEGQSKTRNVEAFPLLSQYVRHRFEQGEDWPSSPLFPAGSQYCLLVTTETQEQGIGCS
ncbi:hypothetical protein SKAU_G00050120 [Synaphobranchus kaupii]|uniref:Fibronectin type-III domain-containing protein n=1 Tax=Synaphobranchus kaupii TaxID=118154 RepID=A0A9Q1J9P5_SYNKA|nr:hypothetical protein SKAU_G00050120 [Synaphobranchus kaupii]